MRNLSIIFCLAMISLVIFAFSENERSRRFDYLGQAAPPDMEFIPGNGEIPSFFMSKSHETNLNYVIYMDWLRLVYVDYPEIAFNATPKNVEYGELARFNDPILKGQMRNPAFAYYPVTGLTWPQIQDYLGWKTNRLNESILLKLGYQDPATQTNEDNFIFESYMAGQYAGNRSVRKPIPGLNGQDWYSQPQHNTFGRAFPFLHPGYRLPTEEEWEYAAKDDFANKNISQGGPYPYGRKYFMLDFILKDQQEGESPLLTYIRNAGAYEPKDMNRPKGATTYDNRHYGIYNMGDNVKEWVLDLFEPEKKLYANSWEVYSRNGFVLAKPHMYCDADGHIYEKDSMGRMYFRTMGISNNGNDFRVMHYGYKEYRVEYDAYYRYKYILLNPGDTAKRYRVVKSGTWKNPSKTARESMYEKDASADVGFRTVLSYLGMPINKKDKVKWQ